MSRFGLTVFVKPNPASKQGMPMSPGCSRAQALAFERVLQAKGPQKGIILVVGAPYQYPHSGCTLV